MTSFLMVVVTLLVVFVALMFGALVEMHRQVLQLREQAGFVDATQPIVVNAAVELESLFAPTPLTAAYGSKAALVILSTGCSTCILIAERLSEQDRSGIFTIVEAATESEATSWLHQRGLEWSPTIKFDHGGRLADLLGVSLTPATVRFENGLSTVGHTLPSPRQLDAISRWVRDHTISKV